jgi:hypothetical protein
MLPYSAGCAVAGRDGSVVFNAPVDLLATYGALPQVGCCNFIPVLKPPEFSGITIYAN